MHNKKRGCIYLVFICFLSLPIPAFAWSGKVVDIADGDSITVLRKKEGFMGYLQTPVEIRLYGIDCPEKGQSLGRKAKQFTSEMVYRKSVEVTEVTTDRYGLTVAIVLEDNLNLNEELVRLAWRGFTLAIVIGRFAIHGKG